MNARTKRAGIAATMISAACAAALAVAPSAQAGISTVAATPFGGAFDDPLHVTGAPGFPDLIYVTQRGGEVRVVENGVQRDKPLIDASKIVTAGGEQGLLSTAFPSDFAASGRFYLYFTNRHCSDDGCDIEIAEFKIRRDNPRRARMNSRRTVLTIRHRDAGNHNGGTAAFGPDGKLWIATGDGGGGNDQFNNASRRKKLLGKLLRINPTRPKGGCDDTGGGTAACAPRPGYRIPKSNPFVDAPGRDEIWSIGLRNPFRFSFDGDDIAIGDVGQSAREEVNIIPIDDARGADFQWPAREGTIEGPRPGRATDLPQITPIHDYPRPVDPPDGTFRGVSVIGGVMMRDPRFAGTPFDPANDVYLFAEAFTSPNVRSFVPDVDAQTISSLQAHDFGIDNVAGVGEDAQDRVYIASLNGTVHRIDPVGEPR